MTRPFYIDNDNFVEISNLQDGISAALINSATVTLTIQDSDGNNVSGISWPLTMAFVSGSDGIYRVVVDKAIGVVEGSSYRARITVVSGSLDGLWVIELAAQVRRVT